jgi:glycosyltransferase involved in cell wall biosynthesis
MRIALIAGEYPPLQGGLGDYTRRLAEALVGLGHELHVITRFVAGEPTNSLCGGVYVHRLVTAWKIPTHKSHSHQHKITTT